MIRTVIIDDEPSAVEVIRLLLQKKCAADVQVIATSNSPLEGKKLINELHPDLVFLDIEMPGVSGLELASEIFNSGTRIIFITAYDSYAINAFKVNALDYLLKPVNGVDLLQAIYKVKNELESRATISRSQLQSLEKLLRGNKESRIGIGMAEKIQFVNTDDIVYCQANGAYTILYMNDGSKIVASKSLGDFQEQLEHSGFFRVHHSFLINLSFIKEYQRNDGGYVVMNNHAKLEVSQRKRKEFLEAVDHLII
jgi:two-component system, LytTR family, response regulator